ncbi:Protein FAR1-RELATED SEQUENCE 5 [Bienertia sinuspersici]
MWVAAYMRHLFWAGMNMTQRSKSIHSFFNGYVMQANEEKEANANCWKYTRTLLTAFPLLYVTPLEKRSLSENVADHLLEDIVYIRKKKKMEEIVMIQKRTYSMWFDIVSHDSCCDCKYFECYRIFCPHLIKVHYIYKVEQVAYHDFSKTVEVQRFDKLMVEFECVCLKVSLLGMNIHT